MAILTFIFGHYWRKWKQQEEQQEEQVRTVEPAGDGEVGYWRGHIYLSPLTVPCLPC